MSGAAGAGWLSVKPASSEGLRCSGGIRIPKRWVKFSTARNRLRRLCREAARSLGFKPISLRVTVIATPPKGLKMDDARKALREAALLQGIKA